MAAELGEKEAIEESEETRVDEDEDEFSAGKRGKHSKKHRHKRSKKHKHKHRKRKHKKRSLSRSSSKSSSRSRSKSPDSSIGENDKPGNRVASSQENGTLVQEAENKATDLDDPEDLPFGWFPEAEDSPSEDIAPVESENASFKLTKSPPASFSPSSTPVDETAMVKEATKASDASKTENKVNLGFPLKIGSLAKSRSKSPEIPGETVESKTSTVPSDDLKSSRSPESKIKEKSLSPSGPKAKKRSRSPSDPKRSKSPMESKIKKSRSRSRSRTKTQSRKSRSKSPRKKSRSSSKSRSRSPHKHRGRSRSRSSSYSRKKSRKRERSCSRSRKSRSRSPTKRSRGNYKTRSRSRSRSPPYRDRKNKRDNTSYDRKGEYLRRSRRSRSHENKYSRRSRSVSPSKSHRRRRPSRSPRRGRSRSPRRDKYKHRSRSRSRSERYRRRSRSRSYSSRRRSRSRSRSRDRHQRRSRSKSKEKNNGEENKGVKSEEHSSISSMNNNKPSATDLVGKAPTISDPSNKRSLAELTEFCKKLTEARGIEAERKGVEEQKEEEEEDDKSVEISHPFLVAPKKDITIPAVLLPPLRLPPTPLVASDKPLTEQFPVSCGTKHHEKEHDVDNVGQVVPNVDGSAQQVQNVFMQPQNQEKLDISGLVVKRMEAQRRLQADPNDVDAMLSLQEVEMKLNSWCQSNVKPGQFTGQLAKTMMPKEKMNSGYQAWARKDMFRNLNPVSGGIGMKLLQKMGWEPGQVLGKRGQGMVEPIALTVKVDRKGLSSNTEKPVGKKGGVNKPIVDLQGKHPISTLQEYCARRKWQVPEFTLIFDEGPPHSKQFLFKVAVNGYEYQHPVVSSNKKHAKAQAAVAALKGLGLVPEDTVY